MFPKITSKREPGVTLGSELRKELSPYLRGTVEKIRRLLCRHPRLFFSLMIILMVSSIVLAFTVLRNHEKKIVAAPDTISGTDMGQLACQAAALQQLWRLQGEVDAMLKKQKPDHADSLMIGSALAQMDSLRKAVHEARRPMIKKSP